MRHGKKRKRKRKKRLSVGHVRGYSMHRYRFAFLLVYKSDKTEHLSTDSHTSTQETLPTFDFYISGVEDWRRGGRGGERDAGISTAHPPPPHIRNPPPKRQHIESSVLSFSSLKQLFGREKKTYRPIHSFSARSWIFLSYKE